MLVESTNLRFHSLCDNKAERNMKNVISLVRVIVCAQATLFFAHVLPHLFTTSYDIIDFGRHCETIDRSFDVDKFIAMLF